MLWGGSQPFENTRIGGSTWLRQPHAEIRRVDIKCHCWCRCPRRRSQAAPGFASCAGRYRSTMTPWRLDPLVAERLEKNRQQLVEAGGPHEGSADMRVRGAAPASGCLCLRQGVRLPWSAACFAASVHTQSVRNRIPAKQSNVEYADAIIAYHQLAFDRNGRPLPSLTHGQRIKVGTGRAGGRLPGWFDGVAA